ncbi:hypothetical protein [Pseudomonas panipatensis]|uniref:Uncharacterized protein n=1 Tax=Pseudomonas panipatensis TaxID=428992 RepID=A0A1G8HJM9_9PSED|nr:hypothetical protein [Pseudomonas panipatensis]SDI06785.1 hypothetical protein SAMN05216272_105270 [Pseudomonas panipatensis]SMP58642.1 hypothetical protein SAMN06295951_104271 [Pseudomonas panipatensis]
MTKKLSLLPLIDSVATAAVAWQKAETRRNSLRNELNTMYRIYFDANGRPAGDPLRRIDPDDPAFAGVIEFTAMAYGRFKDAQAEATKLKRKMRSAIVALERAR